MSDTTSLQDGLAPVYLGDLWGRPVLFLDYEASVEVAITRLRQLGAEQHDGARVAYWRLDHAINGDRARQLGAWVDQHRPCLVVLDGVTRATALYGIDADTDNAGYTRWAGEIQLACRVEGAATDPALLLIDHISEKTGSGLNARGVTAKRDAVTGSAFVLRGGPVSPTRPVRLALIRGKCRHGGERDTPAAAVTVEPGQDGRLTVRFDAPDASTRTVLDARQHQLHERLCGLLEADGPASQRALCHAVGGDDKATIQAIQQLVADGYIERDTNGTKSGGHYPFRSARPYQPADAAA
ncbi:MAG: hypothetical protein WEB03_09670 [Nitriliruptor sp.]|uniref:hypothetical protein n=1 Tax=Nitriliruptor sp. TaxID=2448056 RepID=UPI0034A02F1D